MTVAVDGSAISVPLTVASDAPISQRKVVVTGSAGAFPAASADADRIQIVRVAPEIFSIDPISSTPGGLVTLTVRGRNLHDAQSVSLNPATGITVGTSPAVSSDGSTLTAMVAIAANAPLGAKIVTVTTPGGNSAATPSPANTFTVASQAIKIVTPVISTLLGIVLQDPVPAGPLTTIFAPLVGVSFGGVVTSLSPAVGIIGQTTTVTLQGNGLAGVSAIQFLPATGLTLGVISVAPDGRSVTTSVTIATDAPQTLRTVRVSSGAAVVPFAPADAALFRVSAPTPALESITPITLQIGQPAITLTIRGRNFQNAQFVRIEPPEGVSIAPPVVNAAGTEISAAISAAANAATGPRAIVVVASGGESVATLTPQNTLTLTGTSGSSVTPVISPLVGVVKLDNAPPTRPIGPIVAPAVGVLLQDANPPPPVSQSLFGTNVGVTVGSVAMRLAPTGFAPNTTGTLTIQGFALDGTTAVTVNPSSGLTLGALSVAADGGQVSVPIAIAANAPPTIREVRLHNAGARIPFADPTASRFTIGVGVPQFDSITPIVSAQGTTFTMTIRGSNLSGAIAVTATPADGISIADTFTVNATGTQLDVGIAIAPNAPVGSRVIRALVPGAASGATPSPANTFTVVSP